jgi:hypothetical protein
MKTKLSHILGVSLAVMLVFGLAFVLVPTKEAEAQSWTANQWSAINIPGAPNNIRLPADCDFIAIGSDGATFYAVDNQANVLFKSANAGLSWFNVTPVTPAFTFPLLGLAVAPDDPNCLAVAETNAAGQVYISTDGANTWSTLPALNTVAGFVAGTTVQDIAVSPPTLAGREWMVCTAALNNNAGDGNVFIFGTAVAPMAWMEYGAIAGADPLGQDFTSCAFSPKYDSDSTILVVGSDNLGVTNDTYLNIKNTGFAGWNAAVAQGFVGWPVALETTTTDSPGEAAIVGSGIALPADFDPTDPSYRRVYVFYDSVTNVPDAYRCDDFTCRQLNVNNGVAIRLASISYAGTLDKGTLFVGDRAGSYATGSQVRRCSDPWADMPTWYVSAKPPTGNTVAGVADTQVAVAPDFATSGLVYAGTSGAAANDQSAFSRSTNGGVSFNQISLIDTNLLSIRDVAPAPDGSTLFMATAGNDAIGGTYDSVWRTTSTPLGFLWERVGTFDFGGVGILRLDPNYLETGVLYFAQIGGANQLKYSANGGEIWANRYTPAAITDLTVEDASTLYVTTGFNVRKSTGSGWGGSWEAPVTVGFDAWTIAMAPTYPKPPVPGHVLVGGTGGAAAYSTDGGGSFTSLPPLPVGGNVQVAGDKNYATNNTIYAGSSNGKVYRWVIGINTIWEEINPTIASVSGLAVDCGSLYAADGTPANPSVPLGGADQTRSPTAPAPTWTRFINGLSGGETFDREPSALRLAYTDAEDHLYAIDTTNNVLYGYTVSKKLVVRFTYSIKFLCGRGSESFGVEPAYYATAINIHNFLNEEVYLKKKAVIAHREGEPMGVVSPYAELDLEPNTAIEVDCVDIYGLLDLPYYKYFLWWKCPTKLFVKGFVVIESSQPLNIEAVYTAKTCGGFSIDVEHISPVVSP